MAIDITNHKCPACTGPLHFSGASGMLECDYCGSKFTVEEIENLYAEKEAKAAENLAVNEVKKEKEKAEFRSRIAYLKEKFYKYCSNGKSTGGTTIPSPRRSPMKSPNFIR